MIPLRDNAGASRLSPANLLLIAANFAVFFYELRLGPRLTPFFYQYGMVAVRLTAPGLPHAGVLWPPLTLVTSMFLHGGWLHILGNMLFLFIFGPAVEKSLGHLRFLLFYLGGGVAAGLVTVWMDPSSAVPVIGASGAIAAILGAYFVLYPRARILTLLPLFILVEVIEVPAVFYLMLWFAWQLYAGLHSSHGSMGGVAWWAHVGGFLIGLASAPVLARGRAAGARLRRV